MITTRKKQSFGIAAVELGARKRDRFKYKSTDDVGSEKSVSVSDLL